jgi:bile acid-coenzyme A ligase
MVGVMLQVLTDLHCLDLDEVRRHLADQLARYKHPRSFEIVAVPLRDDAGKVRRPQLRADRIAPTTGGSS